MGLGYWTRGGYDKNVGLDYGRYDVIDYVSYDDE